MTNEQIKTRKFKLVLKMVELEKGLSKSQIIELIDKLEVIDDDGYEATYMPIEFHENNTSAYGFICSDYYQQYSYEKESLEKIINPVLEDMELENENNIYVLEDGEEIYMSY